MTEDEMEAWNARAGIWLLCGLGLLALGLFISLWGGLLFGLVFLDSLP